MTNQTEALAELYREFRKLCSPPFWTAGQANAAQMAIDALDPHGFSHGAAISSQPPAPVEPKLEHESVPLIRATYEKHYPEFNGVASQAVRNHYGAFMTGWYARASLTGTAQEKK